MQPDRTSARPLAPLRMLEAVGGPLDGLTLSVRGPVVYVRGADPRYVHVYGRTPAGDVRYFDTVRLADCGGPQDDE